MKKEFATNEVQSLYKILPRNNLLRKRSETCAAVWGEVLKQRALRLCILGSPGAAQRRARCYSDSSAGDHVLRYCPRATEHDNERENLQIVSPQ